MYIPEDMRRAALESKEPGEIEDKVRRMVVEFLEKNLTEERSDVVIDRIKELTQPRVPMLMRPVVSIAFSLIDRFMPGALIQGVDAGLKAAAGRLR